MAAVVLLDRPRTRHRTRAPGPSSRSGCGTAAFPGLSAELAPKPPCSPRSRGAGRRSGPAPALSARPTDGPARGQGQAEEQEGWRPRPRAGARRCGPRLARDYFAGHRPPLTRAGRGAGGDGHFFWRPATPPGSPRFAASRPERPRDPTNPGRRGRTVALGRCGYHGQVAPDNARCPALDGREMHFSLAPSTRPRQRGLAERSAARHAVSRGWARTRPGPGSRGGTQEAVTDRPGGRLARVFVFLSYESLNSNSRARLYTEITRCHGVFTVAPLGPGGRLTSIESLGERGGAGH